MAVPFTNLINNYILEGIYPNIFKIEIVTQVPKIYPTVTVKDLRKIAGLKNFYKVMEKIISKWMISDMASTKDVSQYGNDKGVSVNNYLIKMINEILLAVNRNTANEKFVALCTMIEWSQAFDRQGPKLSIKSFM